MELGRAGRPGGRIPGALGGRPLPHPADRLNTAICVGGPVVSSTGATGAKRTEQPAPPAAPRAPGARSARVPSNRWSVWEQPVTAHRLLVAEEVDCLARDRAVVSVRCNSLTSVTARAQHAALF